MKARSKEVKDKSIILKVTIIKSKIDHESYKYAFLPNISPNAIIFIDISAKNIDVIVMPISVYPG